MTLAQKKTPAQFELSRRCESGWVHSYITRLSGGDGGKKKLICCVFQNSYTYNLAILFKIQIFFYQFHFSQSSYKSLFDLAVFNSRPYQWDLPTAGIVSLFLM